MNLGKSKTSMWVEEQMEDFLKISFRAEKVLFSGKSEFQTVDVLETRGHGKMLLNDGLVMLTERDEFIYHDMITHVPLFIHPKPKSVLVIGGGDGGTAREVLRHKGVESVVMVEIDAMVIDACIEFIPQTSSELSNPKLELIVGDGVEYVANTKKKFDVIIVDSTDPIGPAAPLFGTEFYQNIKNILTDDGIVVSQAESPFILPRLKRDCLKLLVSFFQWQQFITFTTWVILAVFGVSLLPLKVFTQLKTLIKVVLKTQGLISVIITKIFTAQLFHCRRFSVVR